jgi:adenosylmethionine-8-amino-7-oxononanoate aminotransferase
MPQQPTPKLIFPYNFLNNHKGVRSIDRYTKFGFYEAEHHVLDMCLGSCGCFMLGFDRQDVIDNVAARMKINPFVNGEYLSTNEAVLELSERLYQLSGGYRTIFSSSGSDAVEGALKVARLYHSSKQTGKSTIIGFQDSYHGSTYLTGGLGNLHYMTTHFGKSGDIRIVPIDVTEAEALEHIRQLAPEAMCLIIETCSWSKNLHQYSAQFWQDLRQLCRDHDVLFIVDDIAMCGGKTGSLFGFDLALDPDLFVIGKAFSGGYFPLSACLMSNTVYQQIDHEFFSHGFTYSFSLSGVYSTLKYLDILEEEHLYTNYPALLQRSIAFANELVASGVTTGYRHYGLTFDFDIIPTSEQTFYNHGLNIGVWNSDSKDNLLVIIPLTADDEYFDTLRVRLLDTIKPQPVALLDA